MKIAFLMQESRMGGIEYNSVHLAAALKSGRCQITFIVPGTGPLTERLDLENLSYLICPRPAFISTSFQIGKHAVFNPFATLYNFSLFPMLSLNLAKLLKSHQFDLAVTKGLVANFYGALAARFATIPCIWDMQEIVSKTKAFGIMSWVLNQWAVLFTDKIIVSSKAIAAQFWENIQKKISLIPNGIDTDYYRPDADSNPVRKEWGLSQEEILIAHIARFTYWKGQSDFIKAAALLKDKFPLAKFALIGSPVFENENFENEIKRLSTELGLKKRMLFPGFRNDLRDVLAAADIFVHSSIEPEGCPITLITAMGMGKSCVVTKVEGNDEIVNLPGKQALFVHPENSREIADAITEIIENPELSKQLKQSARERILERYSLKAYAVQSSEVFQDCLK